MIRSALAIFGALVLAKLAMDGYNTHVKIPLQRAVADALEE
jgi:hypothetical protein